MFSKLLKYKLRSHAGLFGILSLAALGISSLGGLLMYIAYNTNAAGDYMTTMAALPAMAGILLCLIAYPITSIIILFLRFYRQHFTDEGYLTFTLPATTHQHLLSSIVNTIIWLTGIVVVFITCFDFLFIADILAGELKNSGLYNTMTNILSGTIPEILLDLISALGTLAYIIMLPITSLTVGSLHAKKHKLLLSFGFGYGVNFLYSIISGMIQAYTYVRFDAGIPEAVRQTMATYSVLIPAIVQLLLAVGGYILCHQLIEKKLNLT